MYKAFKPAIEINLLAYDTDRNKQHVQQHFSMATLLSKSQRI